MLNGRTSVLVQIHNKNNTINSQMTELHVAYKIRNQFDIGLNATREVERGTEVERSDS